MKTLLSQINERIGHFQSNASSHVEKMNKAAGTRARKASLDIEKQLKEFRKRSMATQNSAVKSVKAAAKPMAKTVAKAATAMKKK